MNQSETPVFSLSMQLGSDLVPEFDNPISVYSDDDTLIGFARVFKEGKVFLSELILDYSIPERLDIETGKKYWIKTKYNGNKIEYFTIKIGERP